MGLYVDGKLVGQGDLPVTIPLSLSLAGGFQCGSDPGSPVTEAYAGPFPFDGVLHTVVVDVSGDSITDDAAAMSRILARQ